MADRLIAVAAASLEADVRALRTELAAAAKLAEDNHGPQRASPRDILAMEDREIVEIAKAWLVAHEHFGLISVQFLLATLINGRTR